METYSIEKIAAGGFSAALTTTNDLIIWGSGDFGIFQTPQKIYLDDVIIKDIEIAKTGDSFGAILDESGYIYTWGSNKHGQLGLGDFKNRKAPTKVSQLRKKKVKQIACGSGGFVAALGKDVPEGI